MRPISSAYDTFFSKRIMPVIWFGAMIAIALYPFFAAAPVPQAPFLIIPSVMAVAGFFMIQNDVLGLADEVIDDGDALIVRRSGKEARFAVAEIMSVDYARWVRGAKATLWLSKPGIFGQTIRFCPSSDGVQYIAQLRDKISARGASSGERRFQASPEARRHAGPR
jgi:hypothetical protein